MNHPKNTPFNYIKKLKLSCPHIDLNSNCEILCHKNYLKRHVYCLDNTKDIYYYGFCIQKSLNNYYTCIHACRDKKNIN